MFIYIQNGDLLLWSTPQSTENTEDSREAAVAPGFDTLVNSVSHLQYYSMTFI